MKGFIISISIIFLCFVVHGQGFTQNETTNRNTVIIESFSSENQFTLSRGSDLFNHIASKENGQPSLQRLFPTFQRFFHSGYFFNENSGLNRKSAISSYVFYAECNIPRREGADIIHPFNYFW